MIKSHSIDRYRKKEVNILKTSKAGLKEHQLRISKAVTNKTDLTQSLSKTQKKSSVTVTKDKDNKQNQPQSVMDLEQGMVQRELQRVKLEILNLKLKNRSLQNLENSFKERLEFLTANNQKHKCCRYQRQRKQKLLKEVKLASKELAQKQSELFESERDLMQIKQMLKNEQNREKKIFNLEGQLAALKAAINKVELKSAQKK